MLGLIIMKWNDRTGEEILAKYPAEIDIPEETCMQIYSTHEFSSEPGMISLYRGIIGYASYFTGPSTQIYIIVVLEPTENPDDFEEGLGEISHLILEYEDDEDKLNEILPNVFQRLSLFPTLNWEQKIMILTDDPIRRDVLNRLRAEGSIIKSDLAVWLREQYREKFVDLDPVLRSFYSLNLIEGKTIKNIESIFLVQDILMHRIAPRKILKNLSDAGLPESVHKNYLDQIKQFFKSYKPSDEDNSIVVKTLLDPQVYEMFKLLRLICATREQLEKLKKKGVEDIDGCIKKLWEAKLLIYLHDEHQNKYFALLSDFKVEKIYGIHILNSIKDQYRFKNRNDDILLTHLQLLRDFYPKYQEEHKKALEQAAKDEE